MKVYEKYENLWKFMKIYENNMEKYEKNMKKYEKNWKKYENLWNFLKKYMKINYMNKYVNEIYEYNICIKYMHKMYA